ncbi:hypothetical protein [Saccharicrinis sp. 156]|uniref:hypothetical protein n=1 Tax=Saccharicrinis sp. 156 TaxID=3417574 RepID=UPI003D34CCCA
MTEVVKYHSGLKEAWDGFVEHADNFSFLFCRDYMEYHSDRFSDMSLMLYNKGLLKALLPGNIKDDHFYSHQGLTFGGIVHHSHFTLEEARLLLNKIVSYLRNENVKNFTIKMQPFFYASSHTQIQQYLFESLKYEKHSQHIGAFINCNNHSFPKSSVEKRKLRLDNFYVQEDVSIEEYWKVLEENLADQHKSKPVHTLAEIQLLQNKFPKNIKVFAIKNKFTHKIDAGILVFDHGEIVKMQYIATSSDGRKNRATHALYFLFISHFKKSKKYIDMGTCMTGDEINTSLLYLKQRYGADVYSVNYYNLNTNKP